MRTRDAGEEYAENVTIAGFAGPARGASGTRPAFTRLMHAAADELRRSAAADGQQV
jgi:hypothetical protein